MLHNNRRTPRKSRKVPAGNAMTMEDFLALPDAEKEQIWQSVNRPIAFSESRPLTPDDLRRWNRFKRRVGRPKIGQGAKTIAVTVERGLLERADSYAKKQGLTRAGLIAAGLNMVMGTNGNRKNPLEKRQ